MAQKQNKQSVAEQLKRYKKAYYALRNYIMNSNGQKKIGPIKYTEKIIEGKEE